jgi:hypothetical protein
MSDVKAKAIVHELGHGLSISIGRDGVWLNFTTEGKQCSIHVHNVLGGRSGIVGQVIDAWCLEREKENKHE